MSDWEKENAEHWQREIEAEKLAIKRLKRHLKGIGQDLDWYWRMGDGQGGMVLNLLRDVVVERGHDWPFDPAPPQPRKKDVISRKLSKRVFERDEYRCVSCGTHLDLTCDHVHPESKGGETTFENLQTMCRPCNSKKGVGVA